MNSTANLTKGFSIPKYDELRVSDKMGKKQNTFVYNIHTLYNVYIHIFRNFIDFTNRTGTTARLSMPSGSTGFFNQNTQTNTNTTYNW